LGRYTAEESARQAGSKKPGFRDVTRAGWVSQMKPGERAFPVMRRQVAPSPLNRSI